MTHTEIYICVAALLVCAIAAAFAWHTKVRVRKLMEHMHRMIDLAEIGDFHEETYNESLMSSLENKLAHYLALSEISSQNLSQEKETIKELISDISHQTKTPIANIMLYTQLLSEKETSNESRLCIEALQQQAEKLHFLIGSLVKISRLETGVLTLHPATAPIAPLLEEVIAQISPKAAQKQIQLEFTPEIMHACFDFKWTAEAIYNIADNAVKYTPNGGTISISLLHTELFVRIGISDSGIGIPEEETAKIFQRFYRSPQAGNTEGVGIGLFLSREILARENGYIKVTSMPGKGSTFFVYLPAAQIFQNC